MMKNVKCGFIVLVCIIIVGFRFILVVSCRVVFLVCLLCVIGRVNDSCIMLLLVVFL